MKLISLLLFTWTVFAMPPDRQNTDRRYIRFYKIDNKINVYVNDSLIYESKTFDGNPDLKIDVDLEDHLVKGANLVKVELYNGYEDNDYKKDRFWEIRYEMFNNEESIDYMHQFSSNGAAGLAFDYSHQLYKK